MGSVDIELFVCLIKTYYQFFMLAVADFNSRIVSGSFCKINAQFQLA